MVQWKMVPRKRSNFFLNDHFSGSMSNFLRGYFHIFFRVSRGRYLNLATIHTQFMDFYSNEIENEGTSLKKRVPPKMAFFELRQQDIMDSNGWSFMIYRIQQRPYGSESSSLDQKSMNDPIVTGQIIAAFRKGNLRLFNSGKSRLVKYYNLARYLVP